MNQNANISVRIGRGSVCHPARILDGVKVMACGCPNSANGHGANAMTTVAFGWSAVTCKRGEAHRQSAEDQAIADRWVAEDWKPSNDFRPVSEGGLIVRKRR
jgi:hypothetical protein